MFPSLFVSHGSPAILISESPARDFLTGLGPALGKPKAILVITAHWETAEPGAERRRGEWDHPRFRRLSRAALRVAIQGAGFARACGPGGRPAAASRAACRNSIQSAGSTMAHGFRSCWPILPLTSRWCSFRCSRGLGRHIIWRLDARSHRFARRACSSLVQAVSPTISMSSSATLLPAKASRSG